MTALAAARRARPAVLAAAIASFTGPLACADAAGAGPARDPLQPELPGDVAARLRALSPAALPAPRPDTTNRFADDARAARFGQRLFFDKRLAGPLLDGDNNGTDNTLGVKGEAGRVSCAGCHLPAADFQDVRSARRQLSLASGWTRRRTPSLLDFGQASLLMWDGRRDTAYNQIFGVIESPLEFNSSRLFAAQQIARHHAVEYEAIFGLLPAGLAGHAAIAPADAGCAEMPADPVSERCPKPGHDDPDVVRVLVAAGKAIAAYERLLTCGPSRFDAWMSGDSAALTADEKAGAALFVRKGCDDCHAGPYLTDQRFHNVGSANVLPNFIAPFDDPGAAAGLSAAVADPLNARGAYSDGDDGRLDDVPSDLTALRGAFRTPGLRCVARRPSFMHAGQLRSLEDAVLFFDRGGDTAGFQGEKDARIVPLGLGSAERGQIVAFLRALNGPGPHVSLLVDPAEGNGP
jgi:cytochrome c peroxidase